MKKTLKLEDMRVQSFCTNINKAAEFKQGGSGGAVCTQYYLCTLDEWEICGSMPCTPVCI